MCVYREVKNVNYKVLYRKYRPDNFNSLVGQEHIVQILSNSIKENRVAHAYLFSGPRGTGKTSTARILAKSINCLNNQNGVACNECENCLSFSVSPDIIEIDAASNNGVDEIRELINNVKIMPTSLKYKVYIIDEVHMLSQSAFNALLLTLEEPPQHVIFILATTNLESVPITIVSRCQKFEFHKIKDEDVINTLKNVCEKENINYELDGLNEIAVLSDGGLRDALSMLDQLSKNNEKITLELVTKEIGSISNKKIEELIEALDTNDLQQIENIFKDFENINLNYKVVIKKIVYMLSEFAIKILEDNVSQRITYDDCKNLVIDLNDILNKVNIYVNPYLLIKMVILSYLKMNDEKLPKMEKKISNNVTETQVITDKNNVDKEEKITKIEENKININSNENKVDIRINNCFVNANKNDLLKVKELWNTFINNIDNIALKGLVSDTFVVASSDKYVIIVTTILHNEMELNKKSNEIESSFSNNYKLVFISEDRWEREKREYIVKVRSGYKYELQEEQKQEKNETIGNDISNVFDLDKIVVE